MENIIYSNYNVKKMLSLSSIKNNLPNSDYNMNECFKQEPKNEILGKLENNEIEESNLQKYYFKQRPDIKDCKYLVEQCENLGISYYLQYDLPNKEFVILSSDGNFETNYESNDLSMAKCSGFYNSLKQSQNSFFKTLEIMRDNAPNSGEFDIILLISQ